MVSYFKDGLILGEEGGVGRTLLPVLKFTERDSLSSLATAQYALQI
jgi:hypothetical protein